MRFIPFFLFYAICLNAQQTYYVAQNATGLNTGDSWQHAFTNLHDGLEIANHGDTVLVAIGAYLPDNTGDRSRHFLLKNGVRLFGGFLGTETLFSERNPDLNKPILSGNIGDLLDSTDNSFTIMVMMTPDSTTIIDGLHFTGGHASATNPVSNTSAEVCGGAIYIFGGNSTVMPSFRHCRFENNYAKRDGGAIYLFQPFERISSPIFTNCLFLRNSAGKDGGALHVVYCDSIGQTIRFEKCNFIQNQSMGLGGSGVLVLKGKLYLDLNRDTFISNIGKTNAGCLYIIVREKDSLSIRLDSCLVKNNTGSTIQTFAVTSLNTEYQLPSIKITNSKFDQNFGTLTSQYPVLLTSIICNSPTNNYLLSNCQIDMTSDFQGGIFDQPSDTFNVVGNDYFGFGLVHNIISFPTKYLSLSKNRMECNCFGFGSDGLATENIISGFSDYLNPATNLYEPLIRSGHFQNNLFINNKLRYNYSNPTNASDYSTFTNNVFINNRNNNGTLGIPVQAPLVQSPDYFRNNAVDITCNNLPAYLGCVYNNFYSDPGQIDFFTYKPIECSKLINKGLNLPTISATDFDNNPRIIDGQVDVGIFETKSFLIDSTITVTPSCGNTGSLQLNLPLACGTLTYQWQDTQGNTSNATTNLPSGSYTVTATDDLGRTVSFTTQIPAYPAIIPQVSSDSVVCGGILGAQAMVQVQGSPPFSYTWLDSPFSTDSVRQNLSAGVYYMSITDGNGCTKLVNVPVPAKGALTLLVDAEPILCNSDSTGSLSAIPFSGLMPFQWNWSTGEQTATITHLPLGTYSVNVTDSLNCEGNFTFQLLQPDSIKVSAQIIKASGVLVNDGSILVTSISGGVAPYHFLWENGDTLNYRNQLLPGIYQLTITDQNNCEKVLEWEVDAVSKVVSGLAINTWTMLPNLVHTSQKVYIQSNFPESCFYQIFAADGRLIQRSEFRIQTELEVPALSPGRYYVQLIALNSQTIGAIKSLTIID